MIGNRKQPRYKKKDSILREGGNRDLQTDWIFYRVIEMEARNEKKQSCLIQEFIRTSLNLSESDINFKLKKLRQTPRLKKVILSPLVENFNPLNRFGLIGLATIDWQLQEEGTSLVSPHDL